MQPHYQLALKVDNFTDKLYYTGAFSRMAVYYADGRTVSLSMRVMF
jgi:outer membrane receptor protein involved in Fe transport